MKAALRSATCLSLVAFSATAVLAQDAAAPAAEDDAAADTIIVTGSRIARPNDSSTLPITSISGDDFIQQGNSNIGDTLNELPQLRTTRAQQNPSTGIGIAGLNLLDLRGLGTNRSLVLVNGRRHVAADITSNASSPDINTIPNDLVERVDIVTGGNSAIYGSDAIAGVVNFILRRNFEGLQVRGNFGVSTPGSYGANEYASAMYGKNFADGRGNITLHAEYAHQDRVFASDVPWLRTVEGLGLTDADPAGLLFGSDGTPDSTYFRNITSRSISRYGLVAISQNNATPACGLGVGTTATNGTAYNCLFAFDANGNMAPSSETARFSTGPIGGAVGGNLDTTREERYYSVLPMQNRYNFNMLAHYEFSDALDAFVEAKYVRVDVLGSNSGATSIQGAFQQFDQRERMRLDNPYLSAAQRNTIAEAVLASGCASAVGNPCSTPSALGFNGPLSAAQRAEIAAGTYRFSLARSNIAGAIRDEKFRRETYRIVAGFRGTFNTDWKYEISANYGRMNEKTSTRGFVDQQRLMLSLDAGRNPATGQVQCRSQFDPTAAVAYDSGVFKTTTAASASRANAVQVARLNADIAACKPFNAFGNADNSAAQNYFNVTTQNDAWINQFVLSGFVSGDTSGFLNLPGGPVRFAIGGEYRREDIYFKQDDFAGTAGNTNNVVLGTLYDTDPFKVKEAFAELQIPVFADRPFLHELTLSGAARIAKYQGGVGTVWAYNGGVDWAPIRDIRFRANYSRAVRAPFLTETTGALVNNFAPGFQDPCSPTNISGGTQFRAANCQADLGALLPNLSSRSYSLPVVSGFNADLKAETSDSWTIGAVVEPRWFSGLTISVDYFNIKVSNIINAPTGQTIANSCYDQPTLNNVFCQNFTRFRGPGVGPFNENPGDILGNSLLQAPLNFAKRARRGIDTQVNYRTNVSDNIKLSMALSYTHNFQISNFENPGDPSFENRVLSELGDPEDEFIFDTGVTVGAFTLGHRMRFVGPMTVGVWESYNYLGGRAPQNLDVSEIIEYPPVFYHDLSLEWDMEKSGIGRNIKFYAGVDNLFNKIPPLGATGSGAGGGGGANDRPGSQNSNGSIYDVRGRQIYAGFKAKF